MSETTVTTPLKLPVGTWVLDPVHSQVGFSVKYHVGTFKGSFSPVQGRLEVAPDGTAKLSGSAPVSAVRVQDETLAGHLKSPEFFDEERTPQITFTSTAIRPAGEGIEVEGELTIKGISRTVKATGTVTPPTQYAEREFLGLHLETTVDRTQFGLNWNRDLPDGRPALANEVKIETDLFFVREGS
jgi:polyisoprenoid-binding protein YceI